MSNAMTGSYSRLYEQLAPYPVFRTVLDEFVRDCRHAGFGLAVKGSLAAGNIDRFSDVDAVLITWEGPDEAARWLRSSLERKGRVLALFPATHLGLDRLWIHFLEREGELVKVDVELVDGEDWAGKPDGLLLADPERRSIDADTSAGGVPTSHHPVTLNGIRHRFTGWTWYTYSKIARGELLEAYDSLGVMRSQALVATLLRLHGLPLEGYRRLESRLPASDYRAVLGTVPAAVEREALLGALRAMAGYFGSLPRPASERTDAGAIEPDLAAVMALIDRSEARPDHER